MNCKHFGVCGGCTNIQDYSAQLQAKHNLTLQEFHSFIFDKDSQSSHSPSPIEVFASPQEGFRARAEFRFYRALENQNTLDFAMNAFGHNHRVRIEQCLILLPLVQRIMPLLLHYVRTYDILSYKLYACNFLSCLDNETLITLIYHKSLDSRWESLALKIQKELQNALNATIHIIGRSKNAKHILSSDIICEHLTLFANTPKEHTYTFFKQESRFCQPNPFINTQMLEFIFSSLASIYTSQTPCDMLELYCGSGNFTIPLSLIFRRIFATEVVKSAITLLQKNMAENNVENITPARLNAFESIQALRKERTFFRLKDIDVDNFAFDCVLIDPPRSGVNEQEILHFLQGFNTIVYVSCNPHTLLRDMRTLCQSHYIMRFGLFDQFPHTHHRECIVILRKHSH
ncbi:tRNA (uridine(54)-C5)-methyltransferase TrmA [Helicobacter sp. MIT 21-1697]|uniref:tRNA (uridine(54)-C5)-methyltransferase TrmA n=1 Tax=Helicobacter sp. MIT 21-1697 TaxID=2993733 RepID=UPI00224B818F|nr:tRNA (uridine(54)-C5)-methyltransferase TrmA [Helicobacter sp. MIT 21-1697]MCX2716168.1 tRNA (uridine(54)-C5)-methyltransferase TrmA [Helicobacter sp. MIT 21-1697]